MVHSEPRRRSPRRPALPARASRRTERRTDGVPHRRRQPGESKRTSRASIAAGCRLQHDGSNLARRRLEPSCLHSCDREDRPAETRGPLHSPLSGGALVETGGGQGRSVCVEDNPGAQRRRTRCVSSGLAQRSRLPTTRTGRRVDSAKSQVREPCRASRAGPSGIRTTAALARRLFRVRAQARLASDGTTLFVGCHGYVYGIGLSDWWKAAWTTPARSIPWILPFTRKSLPSWLT